ncbi:MAG TPA: hypothetical protein VNJ02_07205 [Vicinamibacterales bacterium]|nr:hypothetical protein [Vicinamibacterales bacterium]
MARLNDEIDALYRLPLGEFTPARNALAKRVGPTTPPIKELEKPSVPAWAVNQLYWRHRMTFDRLVKAAEQLRAEHRKLLAGKPAHLRDNEKAHRDAIRAASDQVRALLEQANQAASTATMNAVNETLEALPAGDQPGRLTKPLRPAGFEALAGLPVRATAPPLRLVPRPHAEIKKLSPAEAAAEARRIAAEARQAAAVAKREAEVARREAAEEKERQRAAEAELRRAQTAVERAEAAFQKAEQEAERRQAELESARETLRKLRRAT